MIRVYALVVVLGLVGGAVWGAYGYYKDTQQRIATLTQNNAKLKGANDTNNACLLYTSPSPRDKRQSRMPSSA